MHIESQKYFRYEKYQVDNVEKIYFMDSGK